MSFEYNDEGIRNSKTVNGVEHTYYLNGDYDLLYSNAQWKNREGVNHYGYFFFDKTEFEKVIDKYLSE